MPPELNADPAADPPAPVVIENALAAEPPDPALSADPAASDPDPSPPADPALAPAAEPHRGLSPFALRLLSEANQKTAQAAERAEKAEREANEAKALATRLSAKDAPPNPDPRPAQRQQPEPQGDRQAEARAIADQMRLNDHVIEIRTKGFAHFGNAAFNDTINALTATGAATGDFISDVVAVDSADAHLLLDRIAKDPENAVRLAQLPRPQRIAELTRMSIAAKPAADPSPKPAANALAPKPPATVSRAPAPAPRLTPAAPRNPVDWRSDASTEEQFDAGFQKDFVEGRRHRRR